MMCECGNRAFEKFRGKYYCRECYIKKYEGAFESAIKRYRIFREGERVLVALSGGKDSVALLSSLKSLSIRLKIDVEAFHIHLGIQEYSDVSLNISEKVSEIVGVKLNVLRLEDYGFTIEDVRRKPCSVCGNAKRYLMNRFARENGFDVVATGHCAEDILANFLKNLYSGNSEWSEKLRPRIEGYDRLVAKAKPLYEMSERENMIYVLAKNLPFVDSECPKAPSTAWKEIVYDIERKIPGYRISTIRNLARDKKREDVEYRYCNVCGEATSSNICQFCRNVRKFSKKKTP